MVESESAKSVASASCMASMYVAVWMAVGSSAVVVGLLVGVGLVAVVVAVGCDELLPGIMRNFGIAPELEDHLEDQGSGSETDI